MIPYQQMRLEDFQFYWGESVMFHKYKGAWRPFTYRQTSDMARDCTLEELEELGEELEFVDHFTSQRGLSVLVDPLTPFSSDDWVTYEPTLGYFMLRNQLTLLTSLAPRNRYKGLCVQRLQPVAPLNKEVIPAGALYMLEVPDRYMLPWNDLVLEVARRMNEPFPTSWYHAIIDAIVSKDSAPCVLDSNVVFIPEVASGAMYGHLFHNGTVLGQVHMSGTVLGFSPRNTPATKLERGVASRISSKLMSLPKGDS